MSERICAATGCNNPIVRHERESNTDYKKRKCCSRECARNNQSATMQAHAARRQRNDPHAPCVVCNGPIERRPGEPDHQYYGRKTCCPEHYQQYRLQRCREAMNAPEWRDPITKPAPPFDGIGSFAAHNLNLRGFVTRHDRPATHVETQASS